MAPTGSGSGDGSVGRPLDLATAIGKSSPAHPGDTVWLRGGTYRGCFLALVSGTASAPITLRQAPGERAVIDGASCTKQTKSDDAKAFATLVLQGSYLWAWGFEITNSNPDRVSQDKGSRPEDIDKRPAGIAVLGNTGVKIINMVIHDNGDGIGLWETAVDAEVYGTVLYNNGWLGSDRGHGHGIYSQNADGIKRITDVVSVNNFNTGMKAFSYDQGVRGYRFDGIIAANNGSPQAGLADAPDRASDLFVGTDTGNPADDIDVTNSYFYQPANTESDGFWLGWRGTNGRVSVRDNYVAHGALGFKLARWQDATVTGNTFYATPDRRGVQGTLAQYYKAKGSKVQWDANTYYDGTAIEARNLRPFRSQGVREPKGGPRLTWSTWRKT